LTECLRKNWVPRGQGVEGAKVKNVVNGSRLEAEEKDFN
jgi:hypothetical protein